MSASEMKRPRPGVQSGNRGLSNRTLFKGNQSDASEPTPPKAVAQMRLDPMPFQLGIRTPDVALLAVYGGPPRPAAGTLHRFHCGALRHSGRLSDRGRTLMGRYRIESESNPLIVEVTGRQEWALVRLMRSGSEGCTTVTDPAPRWSCYVHCLRARGFEIETAYERHGGSYPGRHGRYYIRSVVTPLPTTAGDKQPVTPARRAA